MPKVSRSTAGSHQVFEGYVDAHEQDVAGWTVTLETDFADMDLAPFFEGAPDDKCQATHLGYVIRGRFGVRNRDGEEEIYEAGDAFVITPGHTPIMFEDSEYIAFTRTDEAREEAAVMMPNIMRFARERGIAVSSEPAPAS